MSSFLSPRLSDGDLMDPFQSLSDEILVEILHTAVYTGSEFGIEIEYGHRHPWNCFDSRWARHLTCVNRRFYAVAIQVFWRNIVVRDEQAFQDIAQLSSKLGHHTWRLELHLPGSYTTSLLNQVLSNMPRLGVFLLRNVPNANGERVYMEPTHAIHALSNNCPNVHRIQFDSSTELPSDEQICELVNNNPQLLVLRIASVSPNTHTLSNGGDLVVRAPSTRLRNLSIGNEYWNRPSLYTTQAVVSMLTMAVGLRSWTALTSLEILDCGTYFHPFLRSYGQQLLAIRFAVPDYFEDSIDNTHILDLCPNATEITWIVKNCSSADFDRCVPDRHLSVTAATIVCNNLGQADNPDFLDCTRHLLEHFLHGYFPQLKDLSLKLRGSGSQELCNMLSLRTLIQTLESSSIHCRIE